jgi:predicted ABC-type ATPase
MSVIQIIAGPPGIGKSTRGSDYIHPDLDILNEDNMRLKYKQRGFVDYNEYSIYRVRDIIKQKLIKDEDFALELNLGFMHQYEYAISAKHFSQNNKLHVILFYTNSLQLCLDRAKARHESGLHLVKPEIITQMYNNTIPLFKSNFDAVDHAVLINADTTNKFTLVAVYNKSARQLDLHDTSPKWFKEDLEPYVAKKIALMR